MTGQNNWERRWHPILQEWVIVAAATNDRPWSGEMAENKEAEYPGFDPKCYLCPGVTRPSGITNPEYQKLFAFNNDYASFSPEAPAVHRDDPFERVEPGRGICRVICFSPKHNITLAEMEKDQIEDVVRFWQDEYRTLGANDEIKNVLIFENKGTLVGASSPHPHGQIYATGYVPCIVKRVLDSCIRYKEEKGHCIFCDLAKHELENKERVVCENEHFVAFIPFFARFVYEVYIVPKRHVSNIAELSEGKTRAFADIHKTMIVKFDNLYRISFPNITILQHAPTYGNPLKSEFHCHIEYSSPTRSPDTLKCHAGFVYGGG